MLALAHLKAERSRTRQDRPAILRIAFGFTPLVRSSGRGSSPCTFRSVPEFAPSTVADAAAVADAAVAFAGWLRFHRRIDRVPGVQASVLFRDEIVLSMACGHADLSTNTPLTPAHRFRIASHSKTFTATAVMQLVERRQLRLDDRLGDLLGELGDSPIASVTVRELLSHAGGLVRDGVDGDFWQLTTPFPDTASLLRLAGDADVKVLSPSDRFKYSNIGFALLGQVLEAVTGVPYGEHVRRSVIEPLGLVHTTPELQREHLAEHATGYSSLAYGDRRLPIDHVATGAMAAATGFSSTADDLVRYAAAHFDTDRRLLGGRSHRQMRHVERDAGNGTQYGLGFALAKVAGRQVVGHGGGFPGFITRTWFDPVDRLAVSVLTNAIDGPALAYATAALRFVELAGKATHDPAVGDMDLSRFCGRFATLWGVFDIVALGGRLHEIALAAPDPLPDAAVLTVVDADTLRVERAGGYASSGELYRFRWNDDGSVASLRCSSGTTARPLHIFAGAIFDRDRIGPGDIPGA